MACDPPAPQGVALRINMVAVETVLRSVPLNLFSKSRANRGKDLVKVAKETAFGTMIRHLHSLKEALARAGLNAHVISEGGSKVTLQIVKPAAEVTCWINASDGHRWWFWLHHNEAIAPADNVSIAVDAIRSITSPGES